MNAICCGILLALGMCVYHIWREHRADCKLAAEMKAHLRREGFDA